MRLSAPLTAVLVTLGLAATAIADPTRPQELPAGYLPVWEDGRLNPLRGVGTPQGDAEMGRFWTDTVPRRLKTAPTETAAPAETPVSGAAEVLQEVPGVFVQVETFADAGAAAQASARLQRQGVPARRGVLRQGTRETPIVVAGPFATSAQASRTVARLQGLGFDEAFIRN